MRSLLIALTVALVIAPFACGNAVAADQVSNEMLTQMGLSSMQVLSDTQGEQIRGKAFMLNFGLVNNSAFVRVNANQSITKSCWGCGGGIAVNGIGVNNSFGVSVNANQRIRF